jgi:dienelactone hydrolase
LINSTTVCVITGVLFLTLAGLPSFASAEAVHFRSASIAPTPLRERLTQERGETLHPQPGIELTGELTRPTGDGPFPALVMLHGCGGPSPKTDIARTRRYVSWGYAVLRFDSFAPRGIKNTCSAGLPGADQGSDALGALDYLAGRAFIDPKRIGLVGFSQGGGAAVWALDANNIAPGTTHHFRAAVLYYPSACPSRYQQLLGPVLVLVGERDDWTPVSDCRTELTTRDGAEPLVKMVILPGAYHDFDILPLKDHPMTLLGHHLEYNEVADHAAATEMRAFLDRTLDR